MFWDSNHVNLDTSNSFLSTAESHSNIQRERQISYPFSYWWIPALSSSFCLSGAKLLWNSCVDTFLFLLSEYLETESSFILKTWNQSIYLIEDCRIHLCALLTEGNRRLCGAEWLGTPGTTLPRHYIHAFPDPSYQCPFVHLSLTIKPFS